MKLPLRPATRRYLLWGIGLSLAHAGATYALSLLYNWTDDVLFESGIPTFLMDDRVHIVREFALSGLMLLHLPSMTAERWFATGSWVPVWSVFVGDALLYGFGITTLVRWLNRPPAVVSRFALPFATRQSMSLATLLAVSHMALSALLYFGFRFATAGSGASAPWAEASQTLAVLHPWLLAGGLQPYGAADPTVIAIALFDALAWGVIAAVIITGLRRALIR